METWKLIPGFDEYEVSNFGAVRKGNLIMSQFDNGLGYMCARIRHNKKRVRFYVHRLVLETFCPTTAGMEVNHIDHNKKNNRLENLEWVTHKENLKKAVEFLGKDAFTKGRKNRTSSIW